MTKLTIIGLVLNFAASFLLAISTAIVREDKGTNCLNVDPTKNVLFKIGLWLLVIGFGLQLFGSFLK